MTPAPDLPRRVHNNFRVIVRFLSVHGLVQNLCRVGRHLLRAGHHRLLGTRSFCVLDAVTVLN